MNKIKYSIVVVFLLLANLTVAQKSSVGNWFVYIGNQKINKKFNWHNEVQYRNYNFIGDMNQLLIRTGIGYNLSNNNNNILLGYGFINTQKYILNTDDKEGVNEHRLFQQFTTRQTYSRFYVQHRYRVEERFLPNVFQLRFRYFLGVNIPLNHKTMARNTVYFSGYNEIFINAQKPLYDRNRLYGALGYVISNNVKIETGFMAQTLENKNRNQFQIALFNNIPLHK